MNEKAGFVGCFLYIYIYIYVCISNIFSSMLLYLHMSLEWMVLFLQEGLGSSGADARSTACDIVKKTKAINI